MQSGANPTLQLRPSSRSSSMRRRSAAGLRVILALNLPLGRPRCEARISRAPLRKAYSMVGRVSRMRVSSLTRPSSDNGTLKSTRMKTRWPSSFKSCIESLAMVSASRSEPFFGDEVDEVAHAARISPLVVVPGDDFHTVTRNYPSEERVYDGGPIVAAVIDRDQLFGGVAENTLHRSIGCGLEHFVDLFHAGAFLDKGHQVHNGNIGRGHAHRESVEPAFEIGDHQVQGLGRAGGGRNHGKSGGAGAAQVFVRKIQNHLIVGVGVDGGHGPALDLEGVVNHLGYRRQTVGGAGRV